MVQSSKASVSARQLPLLLAARSLLPRYQGIVSEEYLARTWELLHGARVCRPWVERWVRTRLLHSLLDLQERWLLPGLTAHVLHRKAWVHSELEAAISEGLGGLLVLGAGLDPLASLALESGRVTTAIEIDHPPTQRLKAMALSGLPASARPRLVPLDLGTTDLSATLQTLPEVEGGYTVVAEGLLMYLRPSAVVDILTSLRSSLGPGTRLIATYAEADPRGRVALGRRPGFLRWRARVAGEPLEWGLDTESAESFFREAGWSPLTHTRSSERMDPERSTLLAPHLRPGMGEHFLALVVPSIPSEDPAS